MTPTQEITERDELLALATALWLHEAADVSAFRNVRSSQIFTDQSESTQQKWIGFARAAITHVAATRPPAINAAPVVWDRDELRALCRDLASVNLTPNAASRQADRIADGIIASASRAGGTPIAWQDISTAPKDGTRILVVYDGDVRVASWGKTSHVPLYGFCLADQGVEDFDLVQVEVWQPLPAPHTRPDRATESSAPE